ncbi:hypothetical protein BAE44_0000708 [Dichanthelium oligosanthes]|uniref:J domain-containing protein n=1 Tax=Dichanthelium oligosanthes TaxID=888268 RepID=A0A1E5WLN1_9POAL|nr:hypothetical protein BAE44_0000708 [Dichanthelium oligosanthes]
MVKAVATPARDRVCLEASKNDYYKVLSLEHSTALGVEEIKRAFRATIVLRYNPDVCPPSHRAQSAKLFLELPRAYETISDPAQRVQYDAELRAEGTKVINSG